MQDCVHSSRRLRDSGTSKSENPVARGDPVSCDRVAKRERTSHSAASCLLPLLASVPSPLDEVELSLVTSPKSIDSIVRTIGCVSPIPCVPRPVRGDSPPSTKSPQPRQYTASQHATHFSDFGPPSVTFTPASPGEDRGPAHSRASGQCPRLSNDEDGPAFGAFEFRHSSRRHLFVSW